MGTEFKREFSIGAVNTGEAVTPGRLLLPGQTIHSEVAQTPDVQVGPYNLPGSPTVKYTVARPSFLSAFLSNLGPSLAGSMKAPRGSGVAGGIAGGFAGINEFEQQQLQDQFRQQQLDSTRQSLQANLAHLDATTALTQAQTGQIADERAREKAGMGYLTGGASPLGAMSLIMPGVTAQQSGFDRDVAQADKVLKFTPEEKAQIADAKQIALQTGQPKTAQAVLSSIIQSRNDPAKASFAELRNSGLSPLQANERLKTLAQHDPITSIGLWHQDFLAKNGREPSGQEIIAAQRQLNPAVQTAGTARSDKSYQFNSGQLDKVGKPVEDAVARLGRLRDTLAQGTPQADALVAPELLTVMAGGAGSGLRMNEAEISRVIGGRSKWESLKAAANQWSLDPKTANSITPDQRSQIHALVEHVNNKLLAKQQLLDQARQDLIDATSPEDHRRIVADARSKLTKIDEGGTSESMHSGPPAGATMKVPGSDGKLHWSDGKSDLGVVQ